MPVRAVLDLNALLAEPERVRTLPIEEARALTLQLASLLVLLSSRASEPPSQAGTENKESAQWLSAEQVRERFGLEPTWLFEHRRQLGSLGIVSRPSRKIRLYDPRKLGRFLESRRETNIQIAQSQRSGK